MLTVKITIPGHLGDVDLHQFADSELLEWCDFRINDGCTRADAWFVVEDVLASDRECEIPQGSLFFATAEAAWPLGYYSEVGWRLQFLRQFDRVLTCHDVFLDNVDYSIPFLPWMINTNHGVSALSHHERHIDFWRELNDVPKSRDLVVFCSDKVWTPEHRLRLRFVQQLKDYFGNRLDWFGNGVNEVAAKWDGLAPYRYSIVLENGSYQNCITEKIMDAYLALSYPIYAGASNIGDYFPRGSFTEINMRDLRGSIDVIESVLREDPYEDSLPRLRQAKSLVTDEYNFLRRMARIASGLGEQKSTSGRKVRLDTLEESRRYFSGPSESLLQRGGRQLERVGRRLQRHGEMLPHSIT